MHPPIQACYEGLGLCYNTFYTEAQLRKAYLKRARETHPDTNPQDSEATEAFQHITHCYEAVRDDQLKRTFESSAYDKEDDIGQYKQAYELLLQRMQVFWRDSADAQVVKQLWKAWSERKTKTETKTEIPISSDIHFVLQIPLRDIYHKTPQKLTFLRKRWDKCTHCVKEETVSLLVNTENCKMTFFGEGHCSFEEDEAHTNHSVYGNVHVVVQPVSDTQCRVDETGVLHCQVDIKESDACGRPKLINLYGKECFFIVPEDCSHHTYSSVIIPHCGLYDADTMERSELIVDCKRGM